MKVFPLVGRGPLLAELDNALAATRAGRGGLVLLIGPAGAGKTRLADETVVRAHDFRSVWAWCAADQPLSGSAQVVRALAALDEERGRRVSAAPALRALPVKQPPAPVASSGSGLTGTGRKTASTLALDHTTVTALRQHRHRQDLERLAAGERWREGGWVFTYSDGRPLAPDRLTRHFNALVEHGGLPPIRLHDLRHGAASLALPAGAELKVVSAMLVHATIQLTADTYTSVLPDAAHQAAENSAALLFRDRRSRRRIRHSRAARVMS